MRRGRRSGGDLSRVNTLFERHFFESFVSMALVGLCFWDIVRSSASCRIVVSFACFIPSLAR
jgi:hypothetical protein